MKADDLNTFAYATWRLSYMVTNERGPANAFEHLRAAFAQDGSGGIGDALDCQYCASIWVALVVLALWYSPLRFVVEALAISGKAIMDASESGVNFEEMT